MREQQRAKIDKIVPFTVILLDRQAEDSVVQPLGLPVAPGSKITGFALVRRTEDPEAAEPVATGISWLERAHRQDQIRQGRQQRTGYRRRRRSASLRYRKPRFNHRAKKEGWLAPSVQRVGDGPGRLREKPRKLAPIGEIARETTKFETQAVALGNSRGRMSVGDFGGLYCREKRSGRARPGETRL
ncbi:MAG: RRXRR domain-containing protein [Deltaproteobacteria bacterium]|nr:RRXRR domain-containing protein [Deltaproteobacteria bacterium]